MKSINKKYDIKRAQEVCNKAINVSILLIIITLVMAGIQFLGKPYFPNSVLFLCEFVKILSTTLVFISALIDTALVMNTQYISAEIAQYNQKRNN